MDYEEKIALLNEEDFFSLFDKFNAEPRIVMSAGKRSIQILGRCHHSHNHSAVFDPLTLKVNCFSECGGGMYLHTWVKRAMDLDDPQDAKEFLENWIDHRDIDFSDRIAVQGLNFEYKERPFQVTDVPIVEGLPREILDKYFSRFDTSIETLSRLVWHTEDGIDPEILKLYDVAYYPEHETIILPHHNIRGEIVGMFERSFRELRRVIRKRYPDMPFKALKSTEVGLVDFPRAKYVPLLKDQEDRLEEKSSFSFPNTLNLYGLHLAAESIKESGIAIVFEGAKSVMLAQQYGHKNAVATHTFGANVNHISMLIKAGAKEIVLAFDKQYENKDGAAWMLYQKKTEDLALKVGKDVKVSRVIDNGELLNYKDSPIDQGQEIFENLYAHRETLTDIEVAIKPEIQRRKSPFEGNDIMSRYLTLVGRGGAMPDSGKEIS